MKAGQANSVDSGEADSALKLKAALIGHIGQRKEPQFVLVFSGTTARAKRDEDRLKARYSGEWKVVSPQQDLPEGRDYAIDKINIEGVKGSKQPNWKVSTVTLLNAEPQNVQAVRDFLSHQMLDWPETGATQPYVVRCVGYYPMDPRYTLKERKERKERREGTSGHDKDSVIFLRRAFVLLQIASDKTSPSTGGRQTTSSDAETTRSLARTPSPRQPPAPGATSTGNKFPRGEGTSTTSTRHKSSNPTGDAHTGATMRHNMRTTKTSVSGSLTSRPLSISSKQEATSSHPPTLSSAGNMSSAKLQGASMPQQAGGSAKRSLSASSISSGSSQGSAKGMYEGKGKGKAKAQAQANEGGADREVVMGRGSPKIQPKRVKR
ncbi:hypothetical protein P389DRAFT_195406 [Cystobasidium minutum MCA 4210]|uniref:uncharacterized protein n=1 Tax=Cystobasidium minutum MCA 4210 TaxID=1397322 RepID=UPI0034CF813E|eukprot:jgi/Rhomi1/195406/gm1.3620_g